MANRVLKRVFENYTKRQEEQSKSTTNTGGTRAKSRYQIEHELHRKPVGGYLGAPATKDASMNVSPVDAQDFEHQAAAAHRQPVTPKHIIQHDAESESTFRHKELAVQKREQASKNKRDDNTAHKIQKSRGASGYGEPKLGDTIRRAAAKDSSLASMASSVRSEVSSLKSAAATGAGIGRKVAEGTTDAGADATPLGHKLAPKVVSRRALGLVGQMTQRQLGEVYEGGGFPRGPLTRTQASAERGLSAQFKMETAYNKTHGGPGSNPGRSAARSGDPDLIKKTI